jgi:hypothetical protein
MMPVAFAALGKGPPARLIVGGIERLPGSSIAGDAVVLQISI